MKERIICFCTGFSSEEIVKGKTLYDESFKDGGELDLVTVTGTMLNKQVGSVLDDLMADDGRKTSEAGEIRHMPPGVYKYKVFVVNTMERQKVLQIMRSFKAALTDSREMIFAVITDTARNWTFAEYIGHLTQEHEKMMRQ